MATISTRTFVGVAAILLLAITAPVLAAEGPQADARSILTASGVQGGVVVHLGATDGRLTAALRPNDRYVVHGLVTGDGDLAAAQARLAEAKLQGAVTIERLSGNSLPYVDQLVQLLVVEDHAAVSDKECLRVLSPGGVLCTRRGGQWHTTVKPQPSETDAWTHTLYDATNNAVSKDQVAGPPNQLQWIAGPQYQRSHDHLASISGLVVAGGRTFSIVDEGPIAAVIVRPQWKLIAQDAYSGVLLWKRPITTWAWHLRGFRSGPSDIARRLVAVGDRVYTTLSYDGPLCALDGATGRTVAEYAGTEGAREVVSVDGMLYVVVGDRATETEVDRAQRRGARPGLAQVRAQRPEYNEPQPAKRLVAIDAATGKLIWQQGDAATSGILPLTLTVAGRRVFFQDADAVFCLDAATGKQHWRAPRPTAKRRPTWSAPTLVAYGDVVLSADRAADAKPQDPEDEAVQWFVSSAGGQAPVGQLIAFSAETGERLWSCPAKECYNAPIDVLVADGLVWTGLLVRANEPGITEGRDPRTGEVVRRRPPDQEFFACGMGHHRCHRNRGTANYLVLGRSGIEFVDVKSGDAVANHWTRGTCQLGVIPANGLLYVPPHTCACFITAKLTGFNCFASKPAGKAKLVSSAPRLMKGPAAAATPDAAASASDWPTYRHDPARSGATTQTLDGKLHSKWKTELGGRLTAPVVAAGRLLVAQTDAHTLVCLDAADGKPEWSFVAGGRVDSPPTVWQGRVLFGSADGQVYCLRADDGRLVWRFRAAPADRRIAVLNQLESAWPVTGSVLVRDGVVYATAGRSSYLEGGMRLCRIDAATGRLLGETVVDHRDPKTGYQPKGVTKGTNIPGALPDVLSSNGESVFLRHLRFDLEGKPQEPNVPHLFCAAGFLDDEWWHRTYWMIGTNMGTNYGGWPNPGNRVPAGRLLAFDDHSVFGFGRNLYIHHGAHVGIDGKTVFHFRGGRDDQRRRTQYRAFARDWSVVSDKQPAGRKRGRGAKPARPETYRWTVQLPILARGMTLTPDELILAGPPHFLEADDPAAALTGAAGAKLLRLSKTDGQTMQAVPLADPPVHDGLIVAAGRVYVCDTAGNVVALAPGKP